MRISWKHTLLAAVFSPALVASAARTAGIDPALLAKASAGDAAAQVAVGERYATGAADLYSATAAGAAYKTAAEWYGKAAVRGDLAGELHLAALYRDGGKGFPRDMVQAAEWYRKAAEQGDAGAQATLGLLYSIGQGVPRDYGEAYYWLSLAAAVNSPMQEQYAANRQMIGAHLTIDEVAGIEERVAKWLAAHPRANASQ